MKLAIKLILTSIVSTFAFFGAANPWPAFAVAFGAWFLLIWSLTPSKGTILGKRER